jgi:hypothetical protein
MTTKKKKHTIDVTEIVQEVQEELTEEFARIIEAFILKYTDEGNPPPQYEALLKWGVINYGYNYSKTEDERGLLQMCWQAINDAPEATKF